MKALVLGVRRQSGTSSKTGKPYDMCTVIVANPIQDVQTEKYTKHGYGYEPADIDLAPHAMPQFNGLKFPVVVELATDNVLRFGRMVPIVVGISTPEKVAA